MKTQKFDIELVNAILTKIILLKLNKSISNNYIIFKVLSVLFGMIN